MVLGRVADPSTHGDSTTGAGAGSRSDGAVTMPTVASSTPTADTAERGAGVELDDEEARPPYLHVGA
jgi:hypothetical protein